MIVDWVFEKNLRPFLTALGWVVDDPFDPDDWEVIYRGVGASDGDAGRWYEWEFAGRIQARLWIARDQGTSIVQVQVAVPPEVEPQVRTALAIFQHFHVLG